MSARGSDVRWAAGLVLLLAAWNDLVVPRLPRRAYVPLNATATAALLAAARARGTSWHELGLDPRRLRIGARRGGACAAVVGAGYAVALAVPAARPLLADARVTGLDRRELAWRVLVRIPVGTVVWEEVAFRGVLPPALHRVLPPPAADAAAAALFGLWHVAPTLEGLALNGVGTTPARRTGTVAAACLATAGVDVLFTRLRRRSGSLLAPVLLHLAANDLGAVAAAAAGRGCRGGRGGRGQAGRPGRTGDRSARRGGAQRVGATRPHPPSVLRPAPGRSAPPGRSPG